MVLFRGSDGHSDAGLLARPPKGVVLDMDSSVSPMNQHEHRLEVPTEPHSDGRRLAGRCPLARRQHRQVKSEISVEKQTNLNPSCQ
jgi:hypothetical protein